MLLAKVLRIKGVKAVHQCSRFLDVGTLLPLFIVSLLFLTTPNMPSAQGILQAQSEDLGNTKVAVYVNYNQAQGSSIALLNMFTWMNATVTITNASDIIGGGLAGVDIFVMPGGSETRYGTELGQQGCQAIRDFVAGGGSYFGICGGSTFACKYALGLFNGFIRRPVPGVADGTYVIQLALNMSCGIPGLSEESPSFRTLYWSSGYFDTDNFTGIIPVATYTNSTLAPMIAFQYGSGSVFLSSPHPEYEEDDDRDGTTAFDYLDDPESEWGIMMKIARWLVEVSPPASDTDTTTGIPYLYLAIAGSVAVIAVASIVVVRRR